MKAIVRFWLVSTLLFSTHYNYPILPFELGFFKSIPSLCACCILIYQHVADSRVKKKLKIIEEKIDNVENVITSNHDDLCDKITFVNGHLIDIYEDCYSIKRDLKTLKKDTDNINNNVLQNHAGIHSLRDACHQSSMHTADELSHIKKQLDASQSAQKNMQLSLDQQKNHLVQMQQDLELSFNNIIGNLRLSIENAGQETKDRLNSTHDTMTECLTVLHGLKKIIETEQPYQNIQLRSLKQSTP